MPWPIPPESSPPWFFFFEFPSLFCQFMRSPEICLFLVLGFCSSWRWPILSFVCVFPSPSPGGHKPARSFVSFFFFPPCQPLGLYSLRRGLGKLVALAKVFPCPIHSPNPVSNRSLLPNSSPQSCPPPFCHVSLIARSK